MDPGTEGRTALPPAKNGNERTIRMCPGRELDRPRGPPTIGLMDGIRLSAWPRAVEPRVVCPAWALPAYTAIGALYRPTSSPELSRRHLCRSGFLDGMGANLPGNTTPRRLAFPAEIRKGAVMAEMTDHPPTRLGPGGFAMMEGHTGAPIRVPGHGRVRDVR